MKSITVHNRINYLHIKVTGKSEGSSRLFVLEDCVSMKRRLGTRVRHCQSGHPISGNQFCCVTGVLTGVLTEGGGTICYESTLFTQFSVWRTDNSQFPGVSSKNRVSGLTLPGPSTLDDPLVRE
jgi:hypothetical protein